MSKLPPDADRVCMDGPFEVDIKVHIISKRGVQTGIVTVGLAVGTFPPEEAIRNALKQAADMADKTGMRLMNRHEMITDMMKIGPIAVPGPKEFPT